MKKVFFLVAAVLVLAGPPCGALDVRVGGKVAGGFGFLKGNDWLGRYRSSDVVQAARPTGSGGAFVDFVLHPNFSLQSGIGFARVHHRYSYTAGTETRNGTLSAHLLELPLVVQPGFEAGRGRVHAFFGFELLIFLEEMLRVERSEELSRVEGLRPDPIFQWGGTGGLGYSFPAGSGTALLELRYGRSLSPIFDGGNTRLTELWLAAGYSVPLKKPASRPADPAGPDGSGTRSSNPPPG